MQEANYNPIRILSIDGSDIYRAMHRVDGNCGLTLKDKNGRLDTRRFRGFLDASLDTDQLKKAYAAHKELPGSFRAICPRSENVPSPQFLTETSTSLTECSTKLSKRGQSTTVTQCTA